MAIITKYTFGKLCSDLDVDLTVSRQNFFDTVFADEQLFYLFNSRENKYLFVYASLLSDEEGFKMKYFQTVPEKEDNLIYVNERAGKANYHLYDNCPMILRDFEDFYIPSSIRSIGNEAVREYREWFKTNDFATKFERNEIKLQNIVSEFNKKYPSKYEINKLEENENLYQKIPNSGKSQIEEQFELKEFENELEFLKVQFDEEFTSHEWRKFSKYSGLHNEEADNIFSVLDEKFPEANFRFRFSKDEITEKLKKAYSLKQRMIKLLTKYLRWNFHFGSKNFDSITLEDFGLKCCSYCSKREQEEGL
jgi:hypothetical protein